MGRQWSRGTSRPGWKPGSWASPGPSGSTEPQRKPSGQVTPCRQRTDDTAAAGRPRNTPYRRFGDADGCVFSVNSCKQIVGFCAPGWPGCDRAFTVRSGPLPVLGVRRGRLAVRGTATAAAAIAGRPTGVVLIRIEPGLSGKRDRVRRQRCRERRGLPAAGQWPLEMTQRHEQSFRCSWHSPIQVVGYSARLSASCSKAASGVSLRRWGRLVRQGRRLARGFAALNLSPYCRSGPTWVSGSRWST